MEKVRLLVVDDDPPIADLVATVARYEGWEAVTANSGEEALRLAAEFQPDIVVLDLMLPDLDGFGVLDRLRRSGTMVPVVFLTARDGVADRVAGLTRGGDDYLVKPFAVEELMARLRTVLRRSAGPGFTRSVLQVADLTMDEDTREVRRAGKLLTLTPTEYEVLRYLMRRSPTVLTKAQILDHVWEYGFGGRSNVVELVVSRLRRKLDATGDPLIHTVRGFGYVVRRQGRRMITRLRRSYRRMRLGTRLALGLGALALIVFAVVGTALTTYMREYLSGQLDTQIAQAQIAQSKNVVDTGTLAGKKYWSWFYAVYDIKDGEPKLRKPEDPTDLPHDITGFTALAKAQGGSPEELLRTEHIEDAGDYRLRACEVEPGVVLISAAPLDDIDNTVQRLVKIQVVAFGFALLVLVVIGRRLLRRGLTPLSDMAHTAHNIASHDLTDSASRLPLRADKRGGGPEVEELRTAFNTMLEHIDDSLAVRAEAEQRLRRFVADASHELRTPLMSVRGYADLFQYAAANAPEERERHLARLRAEAARMGFLLDDLLLLARLDAAEVEAPLRMADGDLVELVEQAADAFRAGHKDHPLTVLPGPSSLTLRLDPQRIRQVLDNLLTNAAVHTPVGTAVSVEVRVEGKSACVRVADEGPGVPAADRERVFDRFYRIDKARSRDRGGSGLGLSVARSLVRAHGGTIRLTEAAGRTVFVVELPVG